MSPKTALHNANNAIGVHRRQKQILPHCIIKRWPCETVAFMATASKALKASARQKYPRDNQELSKIAK